MDKQNNISELISALGPQFNGTVYTDDINRRLYATAACIYEALPLAVIIPGNRAALGSAVRACHSLRLPMLPRGAGTSLSGGTVNRAVVIDLSRYFRSKRMLDETLVWVESGVVLDDLQAFLKPFGRMIGPDPSSGATCTLGGMLANNSGGPHSVLYGNIGRHIRGIETILANGCFYQTGMSGFDAIQPEAEDFESTWGSQLRDLLVPYAEAIMEEKPGTFKNASGYQVWDVLKPDGSMDAAALFCGSEGTLGIICSAVLETVPVPDKKLLFSIPVKDPTVIGPLVPALASLHPASLEYVDATFIELVREKEPDAADAFPESGASILYAEFFQDAEQAPEFIAEKLRNVLYDLRIPDSGLSAASGHEASEIYRLRRQATAILHRIRGDRKPVSIIEDAALPPEHFGEFLRESAELIRGHGFSHVAFGHAGNGNLHLRPLFDLRDPNDIQKADSLMAEFPALVVKFGGTLSGEHGDGRLRTPYLPIMFPRLHTLFSKIKELFDPFFLMNPGVIVPVDMKASWKDDLRYAGQPDAEITGPRLDKDQWQKEIMLCHGCGQCRSYCPVFLESGDEKDTARAKANLLRAVLKGDIPAEKMTDPTFRSVMDSCFNCGQCATDCPTSVAVPTLAIAVKELVHLKIPYSFQEKILQKGKLVSELGSMTLPLSNSVLKNRGFRSVLEKTAGIHRERLLPAFTRSAVEDSVFRARRSESEQKAVLWSGCSGNYNDSLGEQAHSEQALIKAGYQVIHPEWRCCNIAALSHGNIEGSLEDLQMNLEILLPYVRSGIPVIFTSASCGYAFKKEYPRFFPEIEGVVELAEHCHDIHDFLAARWNDISETIHMNPVNLDIVYHEPCHLKAQQNRYSPLFLLEKIPDLRIHPINDSCCGIAGTFGMKTQNFERSMRIGAPLFREMTSTDARMAVSGCTTCQIQIQQGTSLPVIHPMVLVNRSMEFVQ